MSVSTCLHRAALALTAFAAAAFISLAAPEARAMKIQVVKSPGGIEAWLVEERSVPLMAMRFAFEGGSAQDPTGKEGVANFLTVMMDEGAGDLDAARFQELEEELSFRMRFSDSRDTFSGSFQTLTSNRDESLRLLKLALTKPRFDQDAVERMRKQLLSGLAFAAKDPNRVASKVWAATAFPDHPYGRPSRGTLDSIAAIQPADLEAYRKRIFAKDTLKIAVVGDIDAETLGKVLDDVFGDLPAKAELTKVPDTKPVTGGVQRVVQMPVPQSVAVFGTPSIARDDPDFIVAFVMNQILGGGGFASRLMEEVREKRGLAYSVYSYLQPYDHAAIFAGGVATQNEKIGESLKVIRSELERMAKDGPSDEELANAKSYLIGSYALRFDSNAKIAQQLLGIQLDKLGIDYPDKRNELIRAVTVEDVKRIAERILNVDDLIVTIVGQPVGIPG
ncbi:MAG: pitrilysin family protein [Pseudomonadota bacterium]